MNDIGKLFETKLNEGKKIPNKSLWEKINTSLDEEKQKKKRILFYWWLGGGLSVLLGLFLLFGTGNFLNQNSQITLENNSLEQKPLSTSQKEYKKETIKISENDSLKFKNNDEEKLSKIETVNEYETLNKAENSSKKDPEKKIQKGSSKGKSIDETFTISEKYYYYNSKNGKQIVTDNKNEIDSLISKQYKSLDTTATKKKEAREE